MFYREVCPTAVTVVRVAAGLVSRRNHPCLWRVALRTDAKFVNAACVRGEPRCVCLCGGTKVPPRRAHASSAVVRREAAPQRVGLFPRSAFDEAWSSRLVSCRGGSTCCSPRHGRSLGGGISEMTTPRDSVCGVRLDSRGTHCIYSESSPGTKPSRLCPEAWSNSERSGRLSAGFGFGGLLCRAAYGQGHSEMRSVRRSKHCPILRTPQYSDSFFRLLLLRLR